MDKAALFTAYRAALYEGFMDEKNAPKADFEVLRKIKRCLDEAQKKFEDGEITFDNVISVTKSCLEDPRERFGVLWNPGRDLCIGLHMALGAAILAAWVASGGTLTIGSVAAGGVVVSSTVFAALVGGASAGTIACILGSCGDC